MRPRRPPPARWLAAALLLCALPAQAALQLRTDADGLSPAETEASARLLARGLQRLPPAWTGAIDRSLPVQWRDDLPAQVHGRARARRLLLNKRLLRAWMADPAAEASPAADPALSALIHELAHFYDRSAHGRMSSDPRLLDLAGWQVGPLRLGLRTGRNAFTDRSPDRYELTSPVEFVAVNLEHFALDADYACRRPALYRYFSQRLQWSPARAPCAPGLAYLQDPQAGEAALLQLDPARVYAVDYLLAEGNEQAMSRWGHSMLRLVVCAPGRAPGPDCRLDLAHHRVLSFRAFVDDVQISSVRGLIGVYPSRLFVLPLQQVVDDYTKVQLRGLRSVPLRLQPGEIASLLEHAAQLHWNYDGRYYFLGNNCAVETYKLLHDGVPRLASARLGGITPTGVLRRLERAGIADASVLDDAAAAARQGYYFASLSAHYQAMFEVARQQLPLPAARVEDWLDLPPARRAPWMAAGDLRASAALLLLENAARRRAEQRGRDALKRRYLDGDDAARGDAPGPGGAERALRAILQQQGALSRPATLLQGRPGYGLPQAAERAWVERQGQARVEALRADSAALEAQLRALLPPALRAELQQIDANLAALGQRLRELDRADAGMRPRVPPAQLPPSAGD